MKLVTLNIWGGRVAAPFMQFLKDNSNSVDIFCFQEVFNDYKDSDEQTNQFNTHVFSDIQSVLPNHIGHFGSAQYGEGTAIFVNKKFSIEKTDNIFVFRWHNSLEQGKPETLGRNLQYIQINSSGKSYGVATTHGLWNGKGKTDTDDRIEQSNKIKDFISSIKVPFILCGDFNLLPNTKSITIIEQNLENLVKKYNVKSTRTSFYKKPDKYADYIFTSPEINVVDFKVLPDEVSDHSPLYIEFK
jgi:endonuclease/exonuclease/phosphatase family metal-dependent hydrolase